MMDEQEREIQTALAQLSALEPGPGETAGPTRVALARFREHHERKSYHRRNIMTTRRLMPIALTLVMAVLALVAFPSLRAAASDFLGLFRVRQFAPISVSPQQLALLERLGEEGLEPGEFVVTKEIGDPQTVSSPEEAASLAGFVPKTLPDRASLVRTYVMDGGAGYLNVNLAGARAIVEAAGADPLLLPDSLDGARVDVTVYDSVGQLYDSGAMLVQAPSPDVNYPADVDPTVLGEALLQVLGTEPAEAQRIAHSIDWTSTLLLPIPQDMGSYREANVNGVTGVVLEPFNPDAEAAVVWQKDGMVYMMTSGRLSVDELLAQANTVQ